MYGLISHIEFVLKQFKKFFDENPDSLLRIIQVSCLYLLLLFTVYCCLQIIMLRLQRVTFLALSQFLGLGQELLLQVCINSI